MDKNSACFAIGLPTACGLCVNAVKKRMKKTERHALNSYCHFYNINMKEKRKLKKKKKPLR